jgi:paraquat-inducible protein B
MPVRVRVYPERLLASRAGSKPVKPIEPTALLDKLVARGLRAQLRTGNLLTGQLYVALDFFPRSRPAKFVWNKEPVELPTETGSLEGIQVTLAEIARKIEKIPFDAIATDLQRAIKTLDSTLKSTDGLVRRLDAELAPEVRAALTDARRTLGAAERTLSADAPLQQDMRDALHEVTRAAQALRVLADYLERHPEALIRGKKEGE